MLRKHRITLILITFLSFSYPFVITLVEQYVKTRYTMVPIFLGEVMYPLSIGCIAANILTVKSRKALALFIFINIILSIWVWYILPGCISSYNLMIAALLGGKLSLELMHKRI